MFLLRIINVFLIYSHLLHWTRNRNFPNMVTNFSEFFAEVFRHVWNSKCQKLAGFFYRKFYFTNFDPHCWNLNFYRMPEETANKNGWILLKLFALSNSADSLDQTAKVLHILHTLVALFMKCIKFSDFWWITHTSIQLDQIQPTRQLLYQTYTFFSPLTLFITFYEL